MNNHLFKVAMPVFLMLAGNAVCSSVAQVQSNTATKGDLSEVVAELEKVSAQLQLTPAQKEKIKPILMEEARR